MIRKEDGVTLRNVVFTLRYERCFDRLNNRRHGEANSQGSKCSIFFLLNVYTQSSRYLHLMRWTSLISLQKTCRGMNKCDNAQHCFRSHHTACCARFVQRYARLHARYQGSRKTPHDRQSSRRTGIHSNFAFYIEPAESTVRYGAQL